MAGLQGVRLELRLPPACSLDPGLLSEAQRDAAGIARLPATLAEAVAAYRAALTVRTREALPAQWAMTQFNLALVHESLGDLSDGSEQAKHWREAEASVLLALEIFDPVNMPYQHDQATRLLARIRAKLAGEQ